MDLKQYKAKIKDQLLSGLKDQAKREKAIAVGDYVTPVRGGSVRPHYKIPKEDYDELIRKLSIYQGPTISMPTHVASGYQKEGGAMEDDSEEEEVGGSFIGKRLTSLAKDADKRITKGANRAIADGTRIANKVEDKITKGANRAIAEGDKLVNGGKFNFVKSMKHLGHDLGDGIKKAGINAVSKEVANEGVKFAKRNIGKFMSGAQEVLPEALPVAEEVAETAPLLLAAGEKRPKRTRKVSQKEANRHALIRKLMQQHGCTLAEASRHIKEKNLQY